MTTTEPESTLVDYFVVAGYDPEIGLKEDIYPDSFSDYSTVPLPSASRFCPPLQRSYVAKILHHFPHSRQNAQFSPEILPLCMPRGLRFFTEKDVPASPFLHTFANIREDGSRINGTVITFFEEVKDPIICEAMFTLHTNHVRELTAKESRDRTDRPRQHLPPGTVSGGTHTLPRNRRDRCKRVSYYDGGNHNLLFITKSLCLITRLPLVDAPKVILQKLYEIIRAGAPPPLPLESYIFWLLNEIPLPNPGTTLKVSFLDSTLIVQRPGLQELPLFDDSFRSLFQFISVEKFVRLFTCFLLEHQILICSKEYARLMLVCEALSTLAFPFRWQMVYVPILPSSQLKFLEAPVPYVMGWCYEETVPESLFQSNVCVLDVDSGRIEFPEDLPLFPGFKDLCAEIRKAVDRYSYTSSSSVMNGSTTTTVSGVTVPMRNGNGKARTEEWSAKRMSRSFDLDDGMDDLEDLSSRLSRTELQPLPLDSVLRNNSTLARVAAIARRAGVEVNVGELENEISTSDMYANSPVCKQYFQDAKLNNAVRECVLHRFVCMLYSYEHFVVGGQGFSDREMFEASRDSLVCFDKASFLSDQPDSHLNFLAAFLETQMFASFIDCKILSQWEAPDENLVLFDIRISQMRDKLGLSMVRTPTYETSPPFAHSEELINKREETLDYIIPEPHSLAGAIALNYDGIWPELNTHLLEGFIGVSPAPSPWRQRNKLRSKKWEGSNGTSSARPTSTYGGALMGDSPSTVAQQQLKFVEQLLRESKGKTKRMLVDKMGKEAVQLGHLDAGITGVEENTLVASFCDLLERIWAHGINKKQGKSALWTYVLQHEDLEKTGLSYRSMSASMLTPALAWLVFRKRLERFNEAIPAPRILPPSNENDLSGAISDIVQSIQRELGEAKEDPDAPAWSRSILRAANSLFDKISTSTEPRNDSRPPIPSRRPEMRPGALSQAFLSRNASRERVPPRIPASLRKSSSISDFTNPAWGSGIDGFSSVESSPRKRSQSRARSPEGRVVLSPLPTSIAYDLKNVLRMTEIKTDIGYARAFVRLALERKLLHKHLSTLLGNSRLLCDLYKPYAFTRCEDEKEQFLYHILSLNAAQFRCFTNTFTKTKMDYQVVIVAGGGWRGTLPPVWVQVEGSLGSSPQINLPANTPLFKFDHKNLGVLSTLRIGHTVAADKAPKWFLDFVIVRNEITGQTYRFPCGRGFGKGVDDGSLERLLVAEPYYDEENSEPTTCPPASPARRRGRTHSRSQTPQRERSPSAGRVAEMSGNRKTRLTEIQHFLGEAVNALVKYFYTEKRLKSELAHLLCGENGLVAAVEQAFQYGRTDPSWTLRMFRQHYPWDYVERVSLWFYELFRRGEGERLSRAQRDLISYSLKLCKRISEKSALGKDGKFHVFVLISIRDHMLSGFLQLMAWTPITKEMFEEPSFLRTPSHLTYLSRLLDALNEFTFQLEPSLTYGIVYP